MLIILCSHLTFDNRLNVYSSITVINDNTKILGIQHSFISILYKRCVSDNNCDLAVTTLTSNVYFYKSFKSSATLKKLKILHKYNRLCLLSRNVMTDLSFITVIDNFDMYVVTT